MGGEESEDRAKGRPFLKGRTLKFEETPSCAPDDWSDFRVSRKEGRGLDRRGLPAKAWERRLMAMAAARVFESGDRFFRVRVRVLSE